MFQVNTRFSRTGKLVNCFPDFPGHVGTQNTTDGNSPLQMKHLDNQEKLRKC